MTKEVIPNTKYKKCENKIKKSRNSFMHEAFFEFMYEVKFQNIFLDELHFLE